MHRLTRHELFFKPRTPLAARENVAFDRTPVVTAEAVGIVFFLEGEAIVRCPTAHHHLTFGDVLILAEATWCAGDPLSPSRAITLYIEPDFLRVNARWMPADHPLTSALRVALIDRFAAVHLELDAATVPAIAPALLRMAHANGNPEAPYLLQRESGVLFAQLARRAVVEFNRDLPVRTNASTIVERAIAEVVGDLVRPWNVAELAARVAVSASQLTRLFRQEVDTSPAAFIRDQRIAEMARLISVDGLGISESARAVGWRDVSSASRAFKRRYGVSPSVYRDEPASSNFRVCDLGSS